MLLFLPCGPWHDVLSPTTYEVKEGSFMPYRMEAPPDGRVRLNFGGERSELFDTPEQAKQRRDELGYTKNDAWIVKVDPERSIKDLNALV
jgi:hypothetical protein